MKPSPASRRIRVARASARTEIARLRQMALPILGMAQIAALQQPNFARTATTFRQVWMTIAFIFAMTIFIPKLDLTPKVLATAILMVWVASRQNALAIQIHEASHFLLHQHKRRNDLISD